MHRTPQKTKDYFIYNDDGSITDLNTHNTPRALDVIWKAVEAKMKKFSRINKATLPRKEKDALKEQLTTALGNAYTLKDYIDHRKLQSPEGLHQVITAYQVLIRTIDELNKEETSKKNLTDQEHRLTAEFAEGHEAIKNNERSDSPKSNSNRIEEQNPTLPTDIDKTSDIAVGNKNVNDFLKGALPKKTVVMNEDEWNSRESTPLRNTGIESIRTETGDKDSDIELDRTYNHNSRSRRGPRTSTFNVKQEEESAKIGDMTWKDLTHMIQSILQVTHPNATQQVTQPNTSQQNFGNYSIAPRPKYHLVDLKSFSGKTDDYPAWRQNLEVCLERETFKDDKDKALFVLNHLSGTPYDHCKYFVRELTDSSYKNMMLKLDRFYGSTKALDMSIILKLYKLPKLNVLTRENLDVMITVIESALDPLKKMDPTALTNSHNEKYLRLLSLLPPSEQDIYDLFCSIKGMNPNLDTLLAFLYKKHENRRNTEEISKHSLINKQIMKFESREDDESQEESEAEVFAIQEKQAWQPTCGACKGPHGLATCEKFKMLTIEEKRVIVDKCKACSSCLRMGHFVRSCRRKRKCSIPDCNRYHHTLLHDENLAKILYFEEVGGEMSQ